MYLLIPVEMCSWAIRNKFIRPFQVYVLLKSMCSGKVILTDKHISQIKETLELKSKKTVKNNLNILLNSDWVGYNPNSGYYLIRGFKNIPIVRQFKSSTGAEFKISEIKNFKAFVAGAVIGNLANQQKRKKWLSERIKARSNHLSCQSFSYPMVGNNALAKILNISSSTASSLKQLAKKAGYISVKKHFKETGFNSTFLKVYQKGNEDVLNRVRVKNKQVVIQETDEILPLIRYKHLKHWKKSDTYIKR